MLLKLQTNLSMENSIDIYFILSISVITNNYAINILQISNNIIGTYQMEFDKKTTLNANSLRSKCHDSSS